MRKFLITTIIMVAIILIAQEPNATAWEPKTIKPEISLIGQDGKAVAFAIRDSLTASGVVLRTPIYTWVVIDTPATLDGLLPIAEAQAEYARIKRKKKQAAKSKQN